MENASSEEMILILQDLATTEQIQKNENSAKACLPAIQQPNTSVKLLKRSAATSPPKTTALKKS